MIRAACMLAALLGGANALVSPSTRLTSQHHANALLAPRATVFRARLSAEEAVADFKMITEDEAKVRKIAGVGIGLATAVAFVTTGLSYGSLSGGIFGAISTYRTGAEYQ